MNATKNEVDVALKVSNKRIQADQICFSTVLYPLLLLFEFKKLVTDKPHAKTVPALLVIRTWTPTGLVTLAAMVGQTISAMDTGA